MPHPSTSPAYCPDPPVCISAREKALCSNNTASSICLNPECFGLGVQLRAEPWLCHGNSWTWSWTLPKTIDQIQTNMIPPLFPSLSFFALSSFMLSCSSIFFQRFLLHSFLTIRQASDTQVADMFVSSQRIHLGLCDWDNLFPVTSVRFPTGQVLTCSLALTCLDKHGLHHQLSNLVFIGINLVLFCSHHLWIQSKCHLTLQKSAMKLTSLLIPDNAVTEVAQNTIQM